MKTLKEKLCAELHLLNNEEYKYPDREIREDTVHKAHKVAATLFYLCQIEKWMETPSGTTAQTIPPRTSVM